VDRRADIFAVGLILNEMFTGEVPFGTSYRTIGDCSLRFGGLDGVVDEMLSRNPDKRPATVSAAREHLRIASAPPTPAALGCVTPSNSPLPSFSWAPVPGAQTYQISIDAGEWIEVGGALVFTQTTPLNVGMHSMRVRAVDARGDIGGHATVPFSTTVEALLSNTRILFRSPSGLSTTRMDVAADERILLADGHAIKPAWSPDGTKVAYRTYDGNYKLNIVKAGGDGVSTVLDFGAAGVVWTPRWSPDGSHLFYLSTDPASPGLWTVRPDGSAPTRVLDRYCAQFDLSPDGSKMVYLADDNSIVTARLDGSCTRVLRPGLFPKATHSKPRWSPDGTRIAYCQAAEPCTSADCRSADLFVMNADGSSVRNLTANCFQNSNPAWSPDASMIAFYSERPLGSGLFVMHLEDSAVERIARYSEKQISSSSSALMADVEWSPFMANAT
jgi:dipeptidyl aminopeptidase/acylaminoacyl peptidase